MTGSQRWRRTIQNAKWYGLLFSTCWRSSSLSNLNWKQSLPRSEPTALPWMRHLRGREGRRAHILCSFGFVSLPIKVRALSLIRVVVSRLGAFILLSELSRCSVILPFPFSAAENLSAMEASSGE